jgi:ribonuclease-3
LLCLSSVDRAAEDPGVHDYKTRLQELVARHFGSSPNYVLTSEGPDHDRRFHAVVEIDGRSYGPGTGTSKKRAEQAAAHLAWTELEGLDDPAALEPNEQEPAVVAESGSDQ